jgi:putative transposase
VPVVAKPQTLLRWYRAGWRLFWHLKSRPGRPPIPKELSELTRHMTVENSIWGKQRIADDLVLKLGIQVSPRTVRKYMPTRPRGRPRGDLRWSTFPKAHARTLLACDLFVAVTASFRVLDVFVVIEHASRRLVHVNVCAKPTAEWTLRQLRETVGDSDCYRYLLRDRDGRSNQATAQ